MQAKNKTQSTELVKYDAMLRAIEQAHAIDEVKEIKNRAEALQHCHRIAHNPDAERQVTQIRLRAERRMGQLLSAMERNEAGRPKNTRLSGGNLSEYRQALQDNDINERAAQRLQELAGIPRDDFEKAINETSVPSAREIIDRGKHTSLKPEVDGQQVPAAWLALDDLKEVVDNPKQHDIVSLIVSFERYGFLGAITTDGRTILSGHGRLAAVRLMKEEGMPAPKNIQVEGDKWFVPVIVNQLDVVEDQRDTEQIAASISMNRIQEIGGYDHSKLAKNIEKVAKESKEALRGTGFIAKNLERLLWEIDAKKEYAKRMEAEILESGGESTEETAEDVMGARSMQLHFNRAEYDQFVANLDIIWRYTKKEWAVKTIMKAVERMAAEVSKRGSKKRKKALK